MFSSALGGQPISSEDCSIIFAIQTVLTGLEPCAEEQDEFHQVKARMPAGTVQARHHRTLLDPLELPFDLMNTPPVFSQFRRRIEKNMVNI